MLAVQPLDRVQCKRHHKRIERETAGMTNETDDPEIAASRLEAALERIGRRVAVPQHMDNVAPVEPYTGELAARLDSLIDRLRDALATK